MDSAASSSNAGTFHSFRHSVKRSFSTMTDEYRSSSPDSLFVAQDDFNDDDRPSQRPRLPTTLALPQRPIRYAGDGLDYRTPVMSTERRPHGGSEDSGSGPVIDLTEDDETGAVDGQPYETHDEEIAMQSSRAQRLPHFHGRSIIDVEIDEEGGGDQRTESRASRTNTSFMPRHNRESSNTDHHPHFSILRRPPRTQTLPHAQMDDIQFLEERPRSHTWASRAHTPSAPVHRSVTPYPATVTNAIDLTEDDDDVVHLESRVRPSTNLDRPIATVGLGTRSALADRLPMLEHGGRLFNRLMENVGLLGMHAEAFGARTDPQRRNAGTNRDHIRIQTAHGRPPPRNIMFNVMDYGAVAFDLGLEGGNAPPPPKYEPPPAAKAGFTRSPGEDEVVVCPNCGDELAMGDNEQKQEIWVIKKCGHAYCGVCASNRGKGLKKGKGKTPVTFQGPPPFRTCVVDGCKESASKTAMIHVFLSS